MHQNSIEVLHRLGLASSYLHIGDCKKTNVKRALRVIHKRVKKETYMLLCDNINHLVRACHKLLHNKVHIINWTSVCIIFLKNTNKKIPIGPKFPTDWFEEVSWVGLLVTHFPLSAESVKYYEPMVLTALDSVVLKYFRKHCKSPRILVEGEEEILWLACKVDEVHPLRLWKLNAQVLPSIPINKGTLQGTIKIFNEIFEDILDLN